jgi:hypothetical protein
LGGTCGTHGREECTRFWWESTKEEDHSEDRGVDGRTGSEQILGRLTVRYRVDLDGSGYGPVAGSCEYGDESLSSGATELVNGIKRNTFMTFTLLQAEAHLVHPKTKIL